MLYIIYRNSTKKTLRNVKSSRVFDIGNTTVQVFGRMFCWPDSSSQYYFLRSYITAWYGILCIYKNVHSRVVCHYICDRTQYFWRCSLMAQIFPPSRKTVTVACGIPPFEDIAIAYYYSLSLTIDRHANVGVSTSTSDSVITAIVDEEDALVTSPRKRRSDQRPNRSQTSTTPSSAKTSNVRIVRGFFDLALSSMVACKPSL